ncbi:hypothetical protein Poli38472_004781 [Pythium oligandrum]|uniref:Uncharacterized protein n=1 Tax=Pythium oligandrum TaxID=41045 RepID=A0A8K1CCA0_PYTOL|nr:hypothetical protein Poli38472_004781 [Pythium oligandrum]|eukprot:TMW59712.1 hypothetical protein Poli38472_004781 [Pythium oligandrum]
MSLPKPKFSNPSIGNNFGATIAATEVFPSPPPNMFFDRDGEGNAKAFSVSFKGSHFKSLKELVMKHQKLESGATAECGFTDPTGPAQPLPDNVEWAASNTEGFSLSHHGPCEVWCDNQVVFYDDNCAKNYPTAPAKLPYKKELCAGKKMLTSIWVAMHTATWQVYTGCAPLSGAAAGGGEEDCDDLDMAAGEEDCDDLDMADGEEDCDDLEMKEPSVVNTPTVAPVQVNNVNFANTAVGGAVVGQVHAAA